MISHDVLKNNVLYKHLTGVMSQGNFIYAYNLVRTISYFMCSPHQVA